VKKLRLSKTLTIPEATAVSEACRRMAARRVDAVLLTDAHGLLSGIVTDKVFFFLIFLRNLMVTMSPRVLL
jgi:signal-transduction protein with cAMP-binding, CBS, and nucleotidyltransferase domain